MFEFKPTKKGLLRAEFRDRFGAECSAQESSFPDEDCLWLGVEVDIQGNETPLGRMLVTREMAKELIPLLRYFVTTGKLGLEDIRAKIQVGRWVRGVHRENLGIEGRVVGAHDIHITVQDAQRPGPEGQWITIWDAVSEYWEPIDVPDYIPTRYQRIAADDDDVP